MPLKTPLFVRKQSGGMFVVANEGYSTGQIFFVDSTTTGATDSAGYGQNPDSPFATLAYAITACTASKGDTIYIKPGHTETIAGAAGVSLTIAGVRIIGQGLGANRPTFNFTATDSQFIVNANNITIENCRFVAGISAVVSGVKVNAKTDAVFRNCEWYWGGTTGWDFVIGLEFAAGSHRGVVDKCRFLMEPAVVGPAAHVQLTGASSNVEITSNKFVGQASTAIINGITTLSQHLLVLDNIVHNEQATKPYLVVLTGTTGILANTRGLAGATTVAANAVADAMVHAENYVANTTGTIAIIKGAGGVPAVDVD